MLDFGMAHRNNRRLIRIDACFRVFRVFRGKEKMSRYVRQVDPRFCLHRRAASLTRWLIVRSLRVAEQRIGQTPMARTQHRPNALSRPLFKPGGGARNRSRLSRHVAPRAILLLLLFSAILPAD